jgi:hypothetical protein
MTNKRDTCGLDTFKDGYCQFIAIGSTVLNFGCTSGCGYAAELQRAIELLEP